MHTKLKHSVFSRHLFIFLFFCLLRTSLSEISGELPCGKYNATEQYLESVEKGKKCLANLEQNPSIYQRCRAEVCFIFIEEKPFAFFNNAVFNTSVEALQWQRPFRCKNSTELHPSLKGIAFDLHNATSSRDNLCIWAGPVEECEFNTLVDFTEFQAGKGFNFTITGNLLETPRRQCHHNPSTPIIDNRIVIIGMDNRTASSSTGAWAQLIKPFRLESWLIFCGVFLVFVVVAVGIGLRFHVVRGRSLISAFLIFAGEFEGAVDQEERYHAQMAKAGNGPKNIDDSFVTEYFSTVDDSFPTRNEYVEDVSSEGSNSHVSFATKYGLVISLFRLAVVAFFAIFFLFYEVAVVNFLFQQAPEELSQKVRLLSTEQLESYSVLRNSALEDVWNATVNPRGTKYDVSNEINIPWKRCLTLSECLDWIMDEKSDVKYAVTYEAVAEFELDERCGKLTAFETRENLYLFNAGWLHNGKAVKEFRKQIDRELLALRVKGTIRDTFESYRKSNCKRTVVANVKPLIILIPCCLFVLPPLIGSLIVLMFWKKLRVQATGRQSAPNPAMGSPINHYEQSSSGHAVAESTGRNTLLGNLMKRKRTREVASNAV